MNFKICSLWICFLISITFFKPLLGAEDSWDYGKKCAEELGVELPAIDCNQGATVPVTGAANDKCDRPSFGVAHCYTGSKVLQLTAQFKRTPNGPQEKVVTTVQCRKGKGDGDYELAVIQYNETNNKSCWWFPGYRTTLPKPYDANIERQGGNALTTFQKNSRARWGNSLQTQDCTGCHTNGVYIRSPWIMQIDGSEAGSFVRNERTGAYEPGGRIRFPSTINRRGYSCAVEPGQTYPELVKINSAAFDSYKYNATNPRPPNTAPSDTCTKCHFMGFGGSVCSMSRVGLGEHVTNSTLKYPDNRWMPPISDWPSELIPKDNDTQEKKDQLEKKFLEYYKPAIDAVLYCCDSANQGRKVNVRGEPVDICQGGEVFNETRTRNPSRPCPEPVGQIRRPIKNSTSTEEPTH